MASMCLNSYARYEGLGYLSTCLKAPMAEILNYIGEVEIDPSRMPQGSSVEESTRLLELACLSIVTSIIENQYHLPSSMRRLCHFIKTVITDTVTVPSTHSSAERLVEHAPLFPILEGAEATRSTDPSQANSLVKSRSYSPSSLAPVSGSIEDATTFNKVLDDAGEDIKAKNPSLSKSNESKLSASNGSTRHFLGSSSIALSPVMALDQLKRGRATSVRVDEKNRFSLVEKLIGSFLFLRFLIPGKSPTSVPHSRH